MSNHRQNQISFFLVTMLMGMAKTLAADIQAADSATTTPHVKEPFHVGMSARIFTGFNENDANAAVKTWVKTICIERNLNADPNPTIFRDTDSIAHALSNAKVDCVTMTMDQYWSLRDTVRLGSMVSNTRRKGKSAEEYVLVTRKDSSIHSLEDLRGKSLLIHESPLMGMASTWLDTELMEKGYPTTSNFFGNVTGNHRLPKVVLPVFFRQQDASLVTRDAFETLGEMNPQLTQQLRFLLVSPPLVASVTVFRVDYPPAELRNMIRELTNIHTTVSGQQLLTVFQTERISLCQTNEFSGTLEFLSRHQKLLDSLNSSKPARRGAPTSTGGGS